MEVYRPEDAFSLSLQIFKLFGIWPSSVKHPVLRFIYTISGYAFHIFYVSVLLPSQLISMYIMRGDLKDLMDNSFFTLTCVGYVAKLVVFILRRKKVEEFFERLHDPMFLPRSREHLDVLKESADTARVGSITLLSLAMVTCTTWIIFPLVEIKQEKRLLYPGWFPYNTTTNLGYGYTYVFQSLLLLKTAAVNSMIDMMTTNFYVVMMGHMEILKQDFRQLTKSIAMDKLKVTTFKISEENSVEDKETDLNKGELMSDIISFYNTKPKIHHDMYLELTNLSKDLSYCDEKIWDEILNNRTVECTLRYQAILKFLKDVTDFFQIGIVAQICVGSIIICATTYELTSESPNTLKFYVFVQYQICMLCQVFIYSWRGNEVTVKTTELKDAVYECGWISVSNVKFRRSLCIIMSPMQIPLTLCVGKFFLLSVETFFKIIKVSYSFYILLKQVNLNKQ